MNRIKTIVVCTAAVLTGATFAQGNSTTGEEACPVCTSGWWKFGVGSATTTAAVAEGEGNLLDYLLDRLGTRVIEIAHSRCAHYVEDTTHHRDCVREGLMRISVLRYRAATPFSRCVVELGQRYVELSQVDSSKVLASVLEWVLTWGTYTSRNMGWELWSHWPYVRTHNYGDFHEVNAKAERCRQLLREEAFVAYGIDDWWPDPD